MELIDRVEFTACIGGGNFGSKAVALSRDQGSVTLIIDPFPECRASKMADIRVRSLDEVDFDLRGKVQYLQADGCDIIGDVFSIRCPDILVPAAPGHLMALAAMKILERKGFTVRPFKEAFDLAMEKLDDDLILIADRDKSIIVSSYMEEGKMCLEHCPQPHVCPITGREKETPMYMMLEDAVNGACTRSFILHSLLLNDKGGVGGILGKDVKSFLDSLDDMASGESFSVATSCSCHGVLNSMMVE